jgi:hypothetical protein
VLRVDVRDLGRVKVSDDDGVSVRVEKVLSVGGAGERDGLAADCAREHGERVPVIHLGKVKVLFLNRKMLLFRTLRYSLCPIYLSSVAQHSTPKHRSYLPSAMCSQCAMQSVSVCLSPLRSLAAGEDGARVE